ncbi:DMT family transporter [Halomonas sp. 328]|uniref:DMT family transporter n=1 Tax=Halomonas sp. 328 TaxID=2776704 RepID=UPI001E34B94E|nr:DMT family transporter [Halomonas sp. 328]
MGELSRAHLGMLLWALLVGLSFPVVGLLAELPPLLLTALRFLVACVALGWLVRGEVAFLPRGRQWWLYGLLGACLAGFFGAMFWAAHHATALAMATLFVSVPLLAYLIGLPFGVERLGRWLPATLALGALGALGLALAEARGEASGLAFGRGEAVFFLGCVASACYPVLSKWGLSRGWLPESAALRTFWSLACGALLVGVAGLLLESPVRLAGLAWRDALLIVYLGLGSSALTFWLLQRATAVLSPAGVTAYGYLVPFVSMLLLFVQSPSRIDWAWLPGSLLVLLAMGLLFRQGRREQRG